MARRPVRRAPKPIDLEGITTYPLASRKSKVTLDDFGRPPKPGARVRAFLEALPRQLAGDTLRRLAADILRGRDRGRPILWGIGAHVLKVGLSPVIIDLMERGLVTGLALNGAGIVHDFELAVGGHTSEDVEAGLGRGAFGMARETGEQVNRAIVEGDRDGLGLGAAVGRFIEKRRPRHRRVSLLAAAWRLGLPATVHVAIGTDIVHMHPACDPGGPRPRHAPRLPDLHRPRRPSRRRGRLPERGLGGPAPRGVPEGGHHRPEPRPSSPRLRDRQPGLHPVLPAEHQRRRAAHPRSGPRATASPGTTS